MNPMDIAKEIARQIRCPNPWVFFSWGPSKLQWLPATDEFRGGLQF